MLMFLRTLLPFLLGWALLFSIPAFSSLSLMNGVLQLLLFFFLACLPAWQTRRMSYVDIAWPWGLVLIGVLASIYGEGHDIRVMIVGIIYIFMGGRMGMGAIKLWYKGHFKREFPRYKYQQLRWEKASLVHTRWVMQIEILLQALANASFLFIPALLMIRNPNPSLFGLEIFGFSLWFVAYCMETLADVQKLWFLQDMKLEGKRNKICDRGLWRYSRHPNYFAEWMVWNGLMIASIPSWLQLKSELPILTWLLLGFCLLYVSKMMYFTLVYYTGAVPAEHYSAQKRPDYKIYQETTNRFFPGPPKQR